MAPGAPLAPLALRYDRSERGLGFPGGTTPPELAQDHAPSWTVCQSADSAAKDMPANPFTTARTARVGKIGAPLTWPRGPGMAAGEIAGGRGRGPKIAAGFLAAWSIRGQVVKVGCHGFHAILV